MEPEFNPSAPFRFRRGGSLRGQMMKMLRYSGLAVLVVCIAAFASGCGGGGGGGTAEEMPPPVMECPQGQVGTYPDCADPPPPEPTDAEKIAEARRELSTILSSARTRAGAASSAAAAIQTNADATADQITSAISHSNDAQSALARIESANTAATLATTPAEANTALGNAREAAGTLNAAASSIAGIQGAVQVAANQRQQREADEAALTGGSSLIRYLRDNKKISDAVLSGLAATSIEVGSTGASATYPYHKGEGDTRMNYPIPRNTERGVLGVTVSVNETNVSSDSQTGKISGSAPLSNGFDLKSGGRFATVYTDIKVDSPVRQKTGDSASDGPQENLTDVSGDPDNRINEQYKYVADDDYLLAGIWLDDATPGTSILRAFAFGSQPLDGTGTTHDFCTAADVTNTSTESRACVNATGFNTIAGFVDENESTEATYRGGVNGAYFAGGKASHFKANVSLTATFVRGAGADVAGSKISGAITGISAGGNSITGSIDLKEQPLVNTLAAFEGDAAGVIEGHAYTGSWKGQFFGMRASATSDTADVPSNTPERTRTTTYSPDEPGSVAGSFYVKRQTVGEGDAAFIGAFGAHR